MSYRVISLNSCGSGVVIRASVTYLKFVGLAPVNGGNLYLFGWWVLILYSHLDLLPKGCCRDDDVKTTGRGSLMRMTVTGMLNGKTGRGK